MTTMSIMNLPFLLAFRKGCRGRDLLLPIMIGQMNLDPAVQVLITDRHIKRKNQPESVPPKIEPRSKASPD